MDTVGSNARGKLLHEGRRRGLGMLVRAAVAGTMLAGGFANAADEAAIVAKAREEAKQGKFLIMVSSPKGEDGHRMLMDAFQKRFGLKLDWEWLPLTSPVSAPRIIEQAKNKVRLPSAIGGYAYSNFESAIARNGLEMEVDWVGEFSSIFPSIGVAAVDNVTPRFRNRLLRQWDVQYVMVYNTRMVKPDAVPKRLADLADPKWRGKFGMSNVDPNPLQFLALDSGIDGMVELTKKLIDNQPRFKAGPPAVVGAVVSGETSVALSGYTALAESQKRLGAPVDWVVLDDLPLQPLFVFMLKDAPQPTLGKLFLAWLVTEGRALQEQAEQLSLFADADSPTTRKILQQKPNVRVLEAKTDEDVDFLVRAEEEAMKVIAGASGR